MTSSKISLQKTTIAGFQHVLVMYASAVLTPLILGAALGLTPKELTYLVSADLFTCGIATLLQTIGLGRIIGVKLPVILGCTAIAVFPMITTGKMYGIPAIYGSIIFSGLFVFLVAPFFKQIARLFPPVVVGTVISIIGLTLVTVGANNIANPTATQATLVNNLLLATIVIVTIFVINKFFRKFLQGMAILISLIIGTAAAYYLIGIDLTPIKNASWFTLITPFYFGLPTFKISAIIAMCFVSMIIIIESTAVFYTLGEICEQKTGNKEIAAGLRAEGIAQMLGGVLNSFPYNTFAQNVGLLVLSKIKTREVAIAAGFILLLLGLIPKFSALMTIVPKPVLGGAMIILFSTITTYGIKICAKVDLNNTNNILIIAGSIGIALTITLKPELFNYLPVWLKIVFGNGVITGSFMAVLLNLIFNGIGKKTELPEIETT